MKKYIGQIEYFNLCVFKTKGSIKIIKILNLVSFKNYEYVLSLLEDIKMIKVRGMPWPKIGAGSKTSKQSKMTKNTILLPFYKLCSIQRSQEGEKEKRERRWERWIEKERSREKERGRGFLRKLKDKLSKERKFGE